MNQFRINIKNEIVLALLNKEVYGRELSKQLNIPLTTIQRNLSDLERNNIIKYTEVGKNKVYQLSKTLTAKNAIFIAEYYKHSKLLAHYPFLEPIMQEITKRTKSEIVILFGSFAKFNAKKDSDIDLYIETSSKELMDEIKLINSNLSVKIGKFNKEDLLIKEIIKNHVIIKGAERYYEKLKFFE